MIFKKLYTKAHVPQPPYLCPKHELTLFQRVLKKLKNALNLPVETVDQPPLLNRPALCSHTQSPGALHFMLNTFISDMLTRSACDVHLVG